MPVALLGFFTLQSIPLFEIGFPLGFPSHLDVILSLKAWAVADLCLC
jgi:hypothetical protein